MALPGMLSDWLANLQLFAGPKPAKPAFLEQSEDVLAAWRQWHERTAALRPAVAAEVKAKLAAIDAAPRSPHLPSVLPPGVADVERSEASVQQQHFHPLGQAAIPLGPLELTQTVDQHPAAGEQAGVHAVEIGDLFADIYDTRHLAFD